MDIQFNIRCWLIILATGSFEIFSFFFSKCTNLKQKHYFQVLLCIPIEPFSKCFSAISRICCPCCHKKTTSQEIDDQQTDSPDAPGSRRPTRLTSEHIEFSTIGQLTNAAVVAEPPPVFAKYMLRKSVDRLNSEVRHSKYFQKKLKTIGMFLLFCLVSCYQ